MNSVQQKVADVFRKAVRERVAANNHAAWGNADSAKVIEALVDLVISDDEVQLEGTDAISGQILAVVNPSAFAQKLEELPDGSGKTADGEADVDAEGVAKAAHPSFLRRPKKGTGRGKALDV